MWFADLLSEKYTSNVGSKTSNFEVIQLIIVKVDRELNPSKLTVYLLGHSS